MGDKKRKFPGIQIRIGDKIAAWVEWCNDHQRLEIHAYAENNDEPVDIAWATGDVVLKEENGYQVKADLPEPSTVVSRN